MPVVNKIEKRLQSGDLEVHRWRDGKTSSNILVEAEREVTQCDAIIVVLHDSTSTWPITELTIFLTKNHKAKRNNVFVFVDKSYEAKHKKIMDRKSYG